MNANENFSVEYDLALMDIQAKRYVDAEKRFIELTKTMATGEPWFFIGYSRFERLITDNFQVSEIFYCFKKAIDLSPDLREQFEIDIISFLDRQLEQLKALISDYSGKWAYEKIAGGVSSFVSDYSRIKARRQEDLHGWVRQKERQYNFENRASDAKQTSINYEQIIEHYTIAYGEIIENLKSLIRTKRASLHELRLKYDAHLEKQLAEEKKREEEQQKMQIELQKQDEGKEELKKLLDSDSEFLKLKNIAIGEFSLGNYKSALINANQAYGINKYDEELNSVAFKSKDEIENKMGRGHVTALIIYALIFGFIWYIRPQAKLWFIGIVLFIFFIIGVLRRGSRYEKLYNNLPSDEKK